MKRSSILILFLFILVVSARHFVVYGNAAIVNGIALRPDTNNLFYKRVNYPDVLKGKSKVIKNLVYKSTETQDLLCDIYTPSDNPLYNNIPLVILVHGEAPFHGLKDAGQYVSLGEILANNGFAVIAFNHRMINAGNTVLDVISDISSLIDYSIANARLHNYSTDRIGIWAFSAGMPFGIYAGLNTNFERIKCVIGYYGYGDFESLVDQLGTRSLAEYIVPSMLSKDSPIIPVLFARAEKDLSQINSSLDRLFANLLSKGYPLYLLNHSEGEHAFDVVNDNEQTHFILNQTLFFLKQYLKK